MKLFSHRYGYKPVKDVIQINSIDEELRNKLWNAFKVSYWDNIKSHWTFDSIYYGNNSEKDMVLLIKILWHNYYKQPLDELGDKWNLIYVEIKKYFFNCEWNEVYDFIEFIANNYSTNNINLEFMEFCNIILKEESSAYRFVGGKITQITSEIEISEIEEALEAPNSRPVKIHLKAALDLLTDRKSPDYRNSIKESISAVEAICKSITNVDKATLGDCLKSLKRGNTIKIDPALNHAFSSLYGYTSGADGIRHALLDETDLDFEDAKIMIVLCSGFINYLIVKESKAEAIQK